jgi:hypothetical protein
VSEIRIADGVVTAEEDGEAFLLDTGSRRYFRLNEAGLTVWQALEDQAEPLVALTERYPQVGRDTLASDLDGILGRLLDAGLVQRR